MRDTRIGKVLRAARVQAGMTQSMLADRLDVSQQMIQRYEHGKVKLSISKLETLAGILNCTVADLVTEGTGTVPKGQARSRPLTEMELSLLEAFGKIPSLQRKRLALQVLHAFACPEDPASSQGG